MDNEKKIIDSWKANAHSWIDILERKGIESRKLATNKAIMDSVLRNHPGNVLDLGCGEGWLAAELAKHGIRVTGVDAIPELIKKAREKVNATFITASYEDIYENRISFPGLFDLIVINFALIGKESTEKLMLALPVLLSKTGKLIIQTLHPYNRKALNDYESGWKEGSWDGLDGKFVLPYKWYFRTLEDWLELLKKAGFRKIIFDEISHPSTHAALSVIFECEL